MVTTHAASCRARRSFARSRRVLIIISAALTCGGAVFTADASAHQRPCRDANVTISGASRSAIRGAVVCLINQQRAARRLPRLRGDRQLNRSAQGWTNTMVHYHDFSHGSDFASRISAAGFNWQMVGENIAAGFQTPARVVAAWMASPGHCRNILTPSYADVGTGVSDGAIPGAGSPGTWTQDFGLTISAHAPSGNWGPASGCPY